MASSGLVIKKLSVASGVPLPWLDRSLRPLRTADLIALGGGGGRYQKAEAHFQVSHILNVVWGLAGHLPSDAAEAAIIVNGLRLVRTDEAGAPVSARGGPTMGDAMAATLTAAAEYLRAKARGGPPEPWPPIPSAITISLRGGQFAEVHWEGFARQRDLYIPEGGYTSRGALSQTTTVGRPILVAAAELLGDTLNHQERLRAASAHENAASST